MDTGKYLSKEILTNIMKVKTVKVTDKGQISIPVDIRNLAGIEVGDELVMIQDGSKILMEKPENILKDDFKDLVKQSEKVAKKLWSKKEDDIWNTV